MSHLTIAYFTNRPDPKIRWFFDSLHRETGGDYIGIKVVVVDFFYKDNYDDQGRAKKEINERLDIEWTTCSSVGGKVHKSTTGIISDAARGHTGPSCLRVTHVSPKPSVWQGATRLTKQDYFAASNARNTAICHAPDGWIAFVDDLSVLLPGWLNAVRAAMAGDYIVLGAYKKMKKLVVEDGNVVSFESFPGGVDSRWNSGSDTRPVKAAGSWLFGCSLAAPVEALLSIGGFPSICDGLGMEDCTAGMMLQNRGYTFKYDRSMLTYESEEDHAQLPVFLREDPCIGDPDARPRNDMSHAALRILQGAKYHPGYYNEGGLAALRQHILAGGDFPIPQHPQHRWFDGVELSKLPLEK